MIKKITLTAFLATIISSIAFAEPYFGGEIGVDVATTDSVNEPGAGAANDRGMPFTLIAGYGNTLDNTFKFAGELFFTPITGQLSDSHGSWLKTTTSYGISFIPGIYFSTHSNIYARLGVVRTHFDTENKDANGAQFGVGLQSSITRHWDLRSEYVLSTYDSFSNVSSPTIDQFNFGIIYRLV